MFRARALLVFAVVLGLPLANAVAEYPMQLTADFLADVRLIFEQLPGYCKKLHGDRIYDDTRALLRLTVRPVDGVSGNLEAAIRVEASHLPAAKKSAPASHQPQPTHILIQAQIDASKISAHFDLLKHQRKIFSDPHGFLTLRLNVQHRLTDGHDLAISLRIIPIPRSAVDAVSMVDAFLRISRIVVPKKSENFSKVPAAPLEVYEFFMPWVRHYIGLVADAIRFAK